MFTWFCTNCQFTGPLTTWHRPTCLAQLLALRHTHPGAKVASLNLILNRHLHVQVVVGNTEVGVEVALQHRTYPVYLCPTAVPELTKVMKHLHLHPPFT